MNLKFQFITKPTNKKKITSKKSKKQIMIKFTSDHTPLEIQRMDDQELEYLYKHGSPTEQDMADQIIQVRKKLERLDMIMPVDTELAQGTGSPYAGDIRE